MNKTVPVYIISAKRTPIGKLYGALSGIRPDDLVSGLIVNLFASDEQLVRNELDALIIGCGNQAGEDNRNIARMAVLLNGLPHAVFASTVNSLCTSGMDAIMQAARMIMCGEVDFCLAGGVESMSRAPWVESRTEALREDSTLGWRFVNEKIKNYIPTHSMPETAEYLSRIYSISREEQDLYAYRSRLRYEMAQQEGFYHHEIIPYLGPEKQILLDRDEQHRLLSLELMAELPSLAKGGAFVTLGNSARIGDGAAIVALASASYIKRHNIKPKAIIASMAVAAEHPDLMGIAGLSALEKATKNLDIPINLLDHYELTEAFAVQILATAKKAGIELAKINPRGGSISMGNPLGMGAARLLVTLVNTMSQNKKIKYGAAASGAGLGIGTAMILENLLTE